MVGTKSDLYYKGEIDHVPPDMSKQIAISIDAYDHLVCSSKEYSMTKTEKGNVDKVIQSAIKHALIKEGYIKEASKNCLIV